MPWFICLLALSNPPQPAPSGPVSLVAGRPAAAGSICVPLRRAALSPGASSLLSNALAPPTSSAPALNRPASGLRLALAAFAESALLRPILAAAVSSVTEDPYEDDDEWTSAPAMPFGEQRDGYSFFEDDVRDPRDWVCFQVPEDCRAVVQVFNCSSQCQAAVEVFDASLNRLGFAWARSPGCSVSVVFSAQAGATYYALVMPVVPGFVSADATYSLKVCTVDQAGFAEDAWEDDDSQQQAPAITLGADGTATLPGRNFYEDDLESPEDWAFIHLQAGHSYCIETSGLSPGADTVLYLVDTGGLVLAWDDDGGGEQGASRIAYVAAQDTDAYIVVEPYSGQVEPTSQYDLVVRDFGPVPVEDAYEDDDSREAAVQIAPGQTQAGRSFGEDDLPDARDFLAVDLQAGQTVCIETFALQAGCDTVLELYDAAGQLLCTDDDSGPEPLASRIYFTPPAAGTYYILVRPYTSSANPQHGYSIRISAPGQAGKEDAFEDDDTFPDLAREIAPGEAQEGRNFYEDEPLEDAPCDWLKFAAQAGQWYRIYTFGLSGGADTLLELYSGAGELLASDDDSGPEPLASRIDFRAPETATYYIAVRPADGACSDRAQYGIAVEEISDPGAAEDAYEDDDNIDTATTISTDGSLQWDHNFFEDDLAQPADWAKFQAQAGHCYLIETLNLRGGADTVLSVYDAGGALVAMDDDSGAEFRASRVFLTASQSATYYILVQSFGGRSGAERTYDLRVLDLGTASEDPYEDDDNIDMATTISTDGSGQRGHNFYEAGGNRPEDWAKFQAQAGRRYEIWTENLRGGADTVLELRDGAGRLLASDDDGGPEPYASRILWLCGQSGEYFVRVVSFAGRATAEAEYDLIVRELPAAGGQEDQYEDDDSMAASCPIQPGERQAGRNFYEDDISVAEDWVCFDAQAGRAYRIFTENLSENCDTVLALFDADGNLIATDDNGGSEPGASSIAFSCAAAGKYYVRVTPYGGGKSAGAEYDLALEDLGPTGAEDEFEDDDGPEQARLVQLNQWASGRNFYEDDISAPEDWLKFNAARGHLYRVEIADQGGGARACLALRDSEGRVLASADATASGAAVEWICPADGTYFVQITSAFATSNAQHTYAVRIVDMGLAAEEDQYEDDDTPDQAPLVQLPCSQPGRNFWEDSGDSAQDWVKFSAVSGAVYTIYTCDLSGGCDTVLELYDADGQLVASDDDGGDEPLASRILWTCPESGTYWLLVRPFGGRAPARASYALCIVAGQAEELEDEFEDDDTMAQARAVVPGGQATRHNLFEADGAAPEDWLKFEAAAGHAYTIRTENLSGAADTVLELIGADGRLIASDDDGNSAEPGASQIARWICPSSGTYYVRVRSYSGRNDYRDGYDIVVIDEGYAGDAAEDSFEDDDNRLEAAELEMADSPPAPEQFQGGRNLAEDDMAGPVDWVRLVVGGQDPGPGRYVVQVRAYSGGQLGAEAGLSLFVTLADGSVIAAGSGSVEFEIDSQQPVYVRVTAPASFPPDFEYAIAWWEKEGG